MNDATDKGVSKTPEEKKAENDKLVAEVRNNTNKERTSEIQELAEAHNAQREADIAENQPDGGNDQVTFDDDKDKAVDKPVDNSDLSTDKPSKKVDTDQENDDDVVTLNIGGEQKKVARSKVLDAGQRVLQKEYEADTRLEEATRTLKEARELAASIKSGSSQPPGSQPDVDNSDTSFDVRELAKNLVDGDVDEVAETLEQLGIGRKEATQVQNMNPTEVYSMVESALQMKGAMDLFQSDPESGGYGDLYADETMRQMVFDKEAELAKDSNPKPPAERLKAAAAEVREWRNDLVGKAGGNVVDFDKRTDKKTQAKSTPESGGTRIPSNESPQPKSQADIRREALSKMARSRGQDYD